MARIGYGKIGRSMPLTLDKCGNLGGDVEMVAVVKELALRHPDDTFILVGRNTGENPIDVGLPSNVVNPWSEWSGTLRRELNTHDLNHPNLSIPEHLKCQQIMDSLTLDTFKSLDGIVAWVGQHGTSNAPIPKIEDRERFTKPQDAFTYYASFFMRGINHWRDVDPLGREEIYLNADARNRHKMRDLKWPLRHPILTQFTFSNKLKHERYGAGRELFDEFIDASSPTDVDWSHRWSDHLGYEHDGDLWVSTVRNIYSRLEVNGLRPGTPFGDLISYSDDWDRPGNFGLFINEARAIGVKPELARVTIMNGWVLPLNPHFIHGTWSTSSIDKMRETAWLPNGIQPAPWSQYYPRLHSVRCTFTTPSSGSGWATAKPWEAFAAGTVCFFHPAYDTQDNILKDAPAGLIDWLRVKTPQELCDRIRHLGTDSGRSDWEWIIGAQREHFDNALTDLTYLRLIEERLYP